MRVIIESDYQKMSQWAAEHVIERINAFQPTKEKQIYHFADKGLYNKTHGFYSSHVQM